MKAQKIFDIIRVDAYSATPKYLQLSQSIINAIETGALLRDDPLPSINELSFELDISRDTAEKSYKHLKKLGVLASYPGKGYFIKRTDFRQTLRIFLLFNKLSAHKKVIYDSFVSTLGSQAVIDFYIFNNDVLLFKKVLSSRQEEYSHYVIIPHFLEGEEKALDLVNAIPKDKLILLDKKLPGVTGDYAAVFENFEKDIFKALEEAKDQLIRYDTIRIVFPEASYFPVEILNGFFAFCQEYAFNYSVVHDLAGETPKTGEVYIILKEDDLVTLIEKIMALDLVIGKEVGIISYNDTPLKKIILNGITTISSDFKAMGAMAARMILENSRAHQEVPFYLSLRASL
jgi:DNA-binding transcriptional regulator YhcF (GntR family)